MLTPLFRHPARLLPPLLALAGAGVARSHAQADLGVYSDALVNGWQDWSWAVVNTAATSPVHAGTRSASVTTDAWEAAYLHHDAFNSAGYSALTFWIHGGPTGGQLLQVQATLAGTAQTAVTLPALAANTWQQVSLPLSSLGVANRANLDGFWIQDRSGTTQAPFFLDDVAFTAVAAPSTVNLTVNAAQTLRTIDARHFALNAAVWDAAFDTPTTTSLLQEMANQTLRFPGGSLSDEYHWQSNTSGNNTWTWATSFDAFAHVATNTGARVFITANYGTGTPTEAADWVRYANVTKGWGFKYWEIGNENYGSWEADTTARPHDPYTYATRFQQYVAQMRAVDPTIKLGAVVVTGEDSYANYTDHPALNPRTGTSHNGWTPVLLATLKSLGVTPDFLIYHRYAQAPGAESDAGLLSSSSTWAADAADLRQQLTDYLGTAGAGVELICTENNSVYSSPGKQTTSLVNGLFLADSIGSVLQTEFNGLFWWDLRNGQETANNNSAALYGWRGYGDYGIVNGNVPAGAADRYPTFYVAKLLQHFARGGDALVSAASDYTGLAAYAARRTDGSLRVLVINKSPTATLTGGLAISGYSVNSAYTAYTYGIPQDEAARTGTGSADLATQSLTGAASSFTYAFPPYSATVLAFNAGAPPPPVLRPDNQVRLSSDATYLGDNIYNTDGTSQSRSTTVRAGASATFQILVQNDGSVADSFRVSGSAATTGFTVKYYLGASGTTDITTAVVAGTYAVNNLAPAASVTLRAVVTPAKSTASGRTQDCLVTTTSTADATKRDAVKATTQVR